MKSNFNDYIGLICFNLSEKNQKFDEHDIFERLDFRKVKMLYLDEVNPKDIKKEDVFY